MFIGVALEWEGLLKIMGGVRPLKFCKKIVKPTWKYAHFTPIFRKKGYLHWGNF